MRAFPGFILALAFLAGCSAGGRQERCAHEEGSSRIAGGAAEPRRLAPRADLILGPDTEVALFAEAFARRSTWPDVYLGDIVEESSFHAQIVTDDQSFTDELGGWYGRLSDSVKATYLRR